MDDLAVLLLELRLQIELLIISIACLHEFVILPIAYIGSVQSSLGPMVKLLIHFLLLENIEIVLAECINIAQKDHILALNPLVGIRVDLLAFPQRRSHMFNILLHGLTHVSLLLVQVCLADLVFIGLLEHVDSMQALDAFLQLLVVIQVIIEHLVDLVLELLFVVILLTNLLNRLLHLLLHALSLKSHVPDDQAQVLIDDEEVLRLSVHLSLLLLQALDNLHARPNHSIMVDRRK